jgi:hypothetical protein
MVNVMSEVRQTGIVGPWRPAFAMSIMFFVATMSGIYVNEFQGTRVCNKARLFNTSTSSFLLMTTGASVGHFVLQVFRVLAKLGSDDVVHHGSAVWMALLITGIQALTQYLNFHFRDMKLVCEDYFGVQTPAFLWVEWLSTVPVMFYLTSIMDVNKLALTSYDKGIVASAAVGLVSLYALNFTSNHALAVALLTFANVVFVYAQCSLHGGSYFEHQRAVADAATKANDAGDALTDLAIRVKQRRLVCAAFMNYFFTTFPLVYFLKTIDFIDHDTMFVLFAVLNFLAKGIFAMLVTEAHSQLLDPRTYLLFTEKAKADEARRAFIKYVSDEVRVPLKSVTLGIELLNHSDQIKGADRETVLMIKDAGEYMAETLNDVLSMQKLEVRGLRMSVFVPIPHTCFAPGVAVTLFCAPLSVCPVQDGQMVFDVNPFHIVDLLDRVKEKSEVACAKKGLSIAYGADASVPVAVKGDIARLEHVLLTLVHTSVEYSLPGGGVHLSVELGTKTKGQLTFAVRGHGSGVPKVIYTRRIPTHAFLCNYTV